MDDISKISSLLPVTPTIHRIFAWELDIGLVSSATKMILNMVDQDGSFPCPKMDCHDVLPTSEAHNHHAHIHLIHDGWAPFHCDRVIFRY